MSHVLSEVLLSLPLLSYPHTGEVTSPTVKFLNFRTPENFAVIYLKFKQRGQTLWFFIKKMQWNRKQWVCTVCPALPVQNLMIITGNFYICGIVADQSFKIATTMNKSSSYGRYSRQRVLKQMCFWPCV